MKRFKKAYIEITNNCNLNCSFCPKTSREKKFMTAGEYEHIVNEVKPFVNFIYLHLMGEPLMHPKLKEILEISNNNKLKINITTNGTLIKNNENLLLEDKASDCVRKVSFSLHSFEGNQSRKEEDINLLKYLKDILYFSKAFAKKGKTIVLKLWNIDSTNNDVDDKKGKNALNLFILKYIYLYFNDINVIDNIDDSNEIDDEIIAKSNFFKFKEELLVSGNLKIKDHIYVQLGEKFEWPIQTNNTLDFEKIFCYGSIDQFGILSNGDVVPCCLDSEGIINFGNIFENKLENIINGDEFKNFYNKIINGVCPCDLCRKCTYARRRVNK